MINYKGTPLFGPDSSAQHTSEFFAIAGTILFWLLFLIFSFVIKPQPKKPEYKEVQIVLASTPVVQKTEESPAPAEAASASATAASSQTEALVETPAVEPPAPKSEPVPAKATPKPASKKTESPKTTTKKTETPTSVSEPTTYALDMSDGVDFNKIQKNKTIDNSVFDSMDTDDNDYSNNDTGPRVVKGESTMSGTGATKTTNKNENLKSESQKGQKTEEAKHGSDIGKVRDVQEIGVAETGEGKSQKDAAGKDKNSVIWTDGTGARSYGNLDNKLSAEARRSMLVSKPTPFTITFSVDSDGNVMITTIEIKNEFILSDIVIKEMKEKISKWKFGKGSGISKAQFDWVLSPEN